MLTSFHDSDIPQELSRLLRSSIRQSKPSRSRRLRLMIASSVLLFVAAVIFGLWHFAPSIESVPATVQSMFCSFAITVTGMKQQKRSAGPNNSVSLLIPACRTLLGVGDIKIIIWKSRMIDIQNIFPNVQDLSF
jgi:hypothetical protein